MKTTLAGLKSAQASFETFSFGTDNNSKATISDAAQQTQTIIDSIEPRLQQIQDEEPQYNDNSLLTGWLFASRFYFHMYKMMEG